MPKYYEFKIAGYYLKFCNRFCKKREEDSKKTFSQKI